jgi:uncharacterized protein with GYD domain
MNGWYSSEAIKQISTGRHQKVEELVKKFGGEIKGEFCMLGEKDVLFIVELPGTREAMKLSVALSQMSGIAFSTSEAVTVQEFLELVAEIWARFSSNLPSCCFAERQLTRIRIYLNPQWVKVEDAPDPRRPRVKL